MFINEKYGKAWGNTQEIFLKNNVSINRIEILKDKKCSKHKHEYKYNTFFIEKGKLKIDIYQEDYPLIDTTILDTGHSITIKPGLYHQFIAIEDTIAYEIYFSQLETNDIIREI